MAKRYRDIRRGNQLKNALDKYVTYLQTLGDAPPNIGSKGPIAPRILVEIEPFGLKSGQAPIKALVRASGDDYATLGVLFAAETDSKVTVPPTADAIRRDGFVPARISAFLHPTKTMTPKTSGITGQSYAKYAGKSRRCPFGRNAATDELFTSFALITTRFHAEFGTTNEMRRISLQVERMGT